MRITLQSDHIAFADAVARRRQADAVGRGYKEANNAPTDYEKALALHIQGARCECAAYLCYRPVGWNLYQSAKPDLGGFIDVKGIESAHHCLVVQKAKLRTDRAYLLVLADPHPSYVLLGWEWGGSCTRQKYWRDPVGNRPAFFVPQNDTLFHRDPRDLLDILRYRQQHKESA